VNSRNICRIICIVLPILSIGAKPRKIVPPLNGLKTEQAIGLLRDLHIDYLLRHIIVNDPQKYGKVIYQSMRPGTAFRDSQIVIHAGKAPTFVLPDLAGKKALPIIRRLRQRELTVHFHFKQSKTPPPSHIIKTRPAAGTALKPGAKLTVLVSAKTLTVKSPRFLRLSTTNAVRFLSRHLWNYRIIFRETPYPDLAGRIVGQTPSPGEMFNINSTFQLHVGRLKRKNHLKMPRLAGLPSDRAIRQLKNLGIAFRVHYQSVNTPSLAGRVQKTQPAGGKTLPPNQTVNLHIGRFKKGNIRVTVPDLSGKNYRQALSLLLQRGLVPDLVPIKTQQEELTGHIKNSDPAAGQTISRGAHIRVFYYRAGGASYMPHVVGYPEKKARRMLSEAGIKTKIRYVSRPSAAASRGNVAAQSVSGGTMLSTKPKRIILFVYM